MMSEQSKKKLERIMELMVRMDEIHAEMDALLGETPETPKKKAHKPRATTRLAAPAGAAPDSRKDRVLKMLDDGMSIHDIAKAEGCSNQTIYNIKSKHGAKKANDDDEDAYAPESTKTSDDAHVSAAQFVGIRDRHEDGETIADLAEVYEQPVWKITSVIEADNWESYKARYAH